MFNISCQRQSSRTAVDFLCTASCRLLFSFRCLREIHPINPSANVYGSFKKLNAYKCRRGVPATIGTLVSMHGIFFKHSAVPVQSFV